MKKAGLSGTPQSGRSGTANLADQEPFCPATPQFRDDSWPLNNANRESYGYFLTAKRTRQGARTRGGAAR